MWQLASSTLLRFGVEVNAGHDDEDAEFHVALEACSAHGDGEESDEDDEDGDAPVTAYEMITRLQMLCMDDSNSSEVQTTMS